MREYTLAQHPQSLSPHANITRRRWVVGALEASIRAVDEVLRSSYSTQEAQTFEDTYGLPEGWTEELLHTQLILGTKCAFGEYPPVETV